MKKKFVSIVSLLACLALVTGCNEEESSVLETPTESGNNYGDVSTPGITSSDGGNASSDGGQIVVDSNALDQAIAAFTEGVDITIPSTSI